MTRSVTIVNTSNWEHENVVMMVRQGANYERHELAPGDQVMVGPYGKGAESEVEVYMVGKEPAVPVPFRDADDNQDWPRVTVHKPTQGGPAPDEAA